MPKKKPKIKIWEIYCLPEDNFSSRLAELLQVLADAGVSVKKVHFLPAQHRTIPVLMRIKYD